MEIDNHEVTRKARFRQKLTRPITAYITGANALVFGALGAVIAGVWGAAFGLLLAICGAVYFTWQSSSGAADLDFLESYAAERGYTVKPRYRLPLVTPLIRVGPPTWRDGLQYAGREFEGELRLRGGERVPFVHSTSNLGYSTAARTEGSLGDPATLLVLELPRAASDLGLIVCDAPDGPGTRFKCRNLPELRRVSRDREFFREHTITVSGCEDATVARVFAAAVDGLHDPERISWQIENGHLVVWWMEAMQTAETLDRAIDDARTLAEAVLAAAADPTPTPQAVSYVPVEPKAIPDPYRRPAQRLELEYWPHSILSRKVPLGSPSVYCGPTLAGTSDGRGASISWVKFPKAVQASSSKTEYHELLVYSTVLKEAAGKFPPITCTSLEFDYFPMPPLRTSVLHWGLRQESVEFERRYRVASSKEHMNLLLQLFSPAMLVWHTQNELGSFGWQFVDGAFVAYVDATPPDEQLILDLWKAGGRVANRIVNEALELVD